MSDDRMNAKKKLHSAENELIKAGTILTQKAVMFKQDHDAVKNIEKALKQVATAIDNLEMK